MNEREMTKARAIYYNLFANFFVYSKDISNYLELVKSLNILKENPLDPSSAKALNSILEKIDPTSNVKLVQEFDDIFHNPQTKNIHVAASYYDEGVESGKKRVEMLQFLAKTDLRRNEKEFYEYEDSFGFIMTIMSQLLEAQLNQEIDYEKTVHCIFEQILNGFVDIFAKEVYEHPKADIYKDVIVVLHAFVEFERLYLEISKPVAKEVLNKDDFKNKGLSDEEIARRAKNKALKALGPKV